MDVANNVRPNNQPNANTRISENDIELPDISVIHSAIDKIDKIKLKMEQVNTQTSNFNIGNLDFDDMGSELMILKANMRNMTAPDYQINMTHDSLKSIYNILALTESADLSSDLYNVKGLYNIEYGGDQTYFKEYTSRLAKSPVIQAIVKKYYPDATTENITTILRQLNKGGCSYVAAVNVLYENYKDKPAEFEEAFGYPMKSAGKYTYARTVLDFALYCQKNYHHHDTVDEVIDDISGEWINNVGNVMEMYLAEKGIKIHAFNIDFIKITSYSQRIEIIRKAVNSGNNIVIDAKDFDLYNLDGTVSNNTNVGAHAMTVVGVTASGELIVTSWGKLFILKDLSKIRHLEFYKYD